MKRYDVYGLGSVLVDTELDVTDQDLHNLDIKKGLMTLVYEARQDFLQASLKDHLVMSKRACGGSAANTLIALSQFGGKSYFSCKVANDDYGRFYMQDLADNGVDHNPQSLVESGTTGKCLVMITDDSERTMNTFLGISTQLSADDIDREAIANSEYLYLEGYLVTGDSTREAALSACASAREAQTKVALSLSDPGIVAHFREGLKQMVGAGIDLLFCNEAEALAWCETDDIDQALEQLKSTAKQFVVTGGSRGATIFNGCDFLHAPAQPVKAVDTNGAGDMFAGAYLYALTQGCECLEAATFANLAAGHVVSDYGPRLRSDGYATLKASLKVRD